MVLASIFIGEQHDLRDDNSSFWSIRTDQRQGQSLATTYWSLAGERVNAAHLLSTTKDQSGDFWLLAYSPKKATDYRRFTRFIGKVFTGSTGNTAFIRYLAYAARHQHWSFGWIWSGASQARSEDSGRRSMIQLGEHTCVYLATGCTDMRNYVECSVMCSNSEAWVYRNDFILNYCT